MKKVLMIAAGLVSLSSMVYAQEPERPCAADAARLCSNVEPGGGAQIACLKAHKEELSPGCKKKVLQMKVKQMEQQQYEQQQQQHQMPPQ